jgi:hypothetical protein
MANSTLVSDEDFNILRFYVISWCITFEDEDARSSIKTYTMTKIIVDSLHFRGHRWILTLQGKGYKMLSINREGLCHHPVQKPCTTRAENGKARAVRDGHGPVNRSIDSSYGDKLASQTKSTELTVSTILMCNVIFCIGASVSDGITVRTETILYIEGYLVI